MKTVVAELKKKKITELAKEIETVKEEIAQMRLKLKVSPAKDTNMLIKKRKKLAVLLTILTEKNNQS